MFDTALSNPLRTNVLSFASEDGEYVCSVDTYQGTHDGDFMGIAPTDASVEVQGVIMVRIEKGQIAEMWNMMNFLGLLQQVGAVPSLDELASSSGRGTWESFGTSNPISDFFACQATGRTIKQAVSR